MIRRLRVETFGETQTQFARRMGVTLRTVFRWEHGRIPEPRVVTKITNMYMEKYNE